MASKMTLTDYQKKYKQMQQNNGIDNSVSSGSTETNNQNNLDSATQDYYNMAKQQEYSALLDKEVQLENAKANALKYSNNQLAAQGMAGSGYAQNAQLGIQNQYLNRLTEAQNTTSQNIASLNQAQREEELANANDRFESVTTMLTQASELSQMDELLANYGYGTIDKSGNFVWNDKPENMSSDDWNQIKYYYGLQKSAIESAQPQNYATYNSLDSLKTASYLKTNGNVGNLGDDFGKEINVLWYYASAGQFQNGDSIHLTNGKGETIYMQLTSNGFRTISEQEYRDSNNQYTITYSGKGAFLEKQK